MSNTDLSSLPPTLAGAADVRAPAFGLASGSLFGCIVADPPWPVRQPPRKWKTGTVNEPLPYPTMKVEEIAALQVERLAAESCHLYLWTVNRFVRDAYDVAEAWGFTPSMLLTWVKTPMGIGPGRQYASTTEFALFAYRGPQAREPKRIERNWWNWPRGKHSAKPEAFQDIVESVSPGPYLELFARRQRMGWSSWGNEAPQDVVLSSASLGDRSRTREQQSQGCPSISVTAGKTAQCPSAAEIARDESEDIAAEREVLRLHAEVRDLKATLDRHNGANPILSWYSANH